jgi:hypothetical protein
MSTTNEIFSLLYGIMDKLERIEQHLDIDNTAKESKGEVVFKKLSVVESNNNIIEFGKND